MKHLTFFSLIEVLVRGIHECPKCHQPELNYEVEGRRIYCLKCDIKKKKRSPEKREILRYHRFISSEFAGVERGRVRTKVWWEDVW